MITKVSLLPSEFKEMVKQIREIEISLPSKFGRSLTQGELINRETLGKSLVIKKDTQKGEIFTNEHIEVKSPGKGLSPNNIKRILGRSSRANLKKGDFIYPCHFENVQNQKVKFNFNLEWGIPIRYHDFKRLTSRGNPELVEFHLSYSDLKLNPSHFLKLEETLPFKFLVHAPELFENDHILDLASEDEDHRIKSVEHLQRVIDISADLAQFFKKTKNPRIIVNIGGFSSDSFVSNKRREKKI